MNGFRYYVKGSCFINPGNNLEELKEIFSGLDITIVESGSDIQWNTLKFEGLTKSLDFLDEIKPWHCFVFLEMQVNPSIY